MGGQQGNLASMLLPLAMFAAIFYFMIIRPQKKRQKTHDDMLASISKGDMVITAGGFFGTVREILDDSFILELAEGVKVRILKSSVSMRKDLMAEPKKKAKKVVSEKTESSCDAEVSAPVEETENKA
ncbi:MAG: preprotein translocase subunit YajC [Synergistaceae bacterium]